MGGVSIVGLVAPGAPVSMPEDRGRLDFRVIGKVRLPVSRWLLPNVVIRWFVPFILRLFCKLCNKLTSGFESSTLCKRVKEDRDGFYTALAKSRLPAFYPSEKRCHGWEL